MDNRDIEKLAPQPQTNSQFQNKQRVAERVFDQWLDDQFNGRGNYNPFFKIIKKIHDDEPPFIPHIRTWK